jgi:DNA-directed RNA polymerase alpha subunit
MANALMRGGVATLLDLTNFSQIDLFKSSVGKIRVQIIIKELERYGLELKPDPI